MGGEESDLEIVSLPDIWATTGILFGLQVAYTAWRVDRIVHAAAPAVPILPPCELINLAAMVIAALGVFAVPMLSQSDALAQLSFAAYTTLYCAYPLALLGHYDMFTGVLGGEAPERPYVRGGAYCTPQERNVCWLASAMVCAIMVLGLRSPGGAGAMGAAIVFVPAAIAFFVMVNRRTNEALDGVYAPLLPQLDALEEDDPDFRYEVQLTLSDDDASLPLGLELIQSRDRWIEVAEIIPHSWVARYAPLMCAGMRLERLSSASRDETSAWGLACDDVMRIAREEARPVVLTFEHPWQREHEPASAGESDGAGLGRPYFYNSATGERMPERPHALAAVLAAMRRRLRLSQSTSRHTGGGGARNRALTMTQAARRRFQLPADAPSSPAVMATAIRELLDGGCASTRALPPRSSGIPQWPVITVTPGSDRLPPHRLPPVCAAADMCCSTSC